MNVEKGTSYLFSKFETRLYQRNKVEITLTSLLLHIN